MKLYIIDYEKAKALSIIPFGAMMAFCSFFIMLSGHFMWIPTMLFGVGCVGFGIFRLVAFSKKQEEFDDFKRCGKKLTGRIAAVHQGNNIAKKRKNATPVIAECVVTDPDTGEEKYFRSRSSIVGGLVDIGGMYADIYVYPSGQYYVDLKSARLEAEKNGVKVHDFR